MPKKFINALHLYLKTEQSNGNSLILKAEKGKGRVCKPKIMGRNIIPAAVDAIKNAQQEVLFMGFKINQGCNASAKLLAALTHLNEQAEKNQKTIRVRILINAMKGIAGSVFKSKSPSIEQFKNVDFPHLDFQYCEHSHQMFGSYHSKQIIIDNRTAILSSGDFGKDKNYGEGMEGVIDINTQINGEEIVKHIREDFISAWRSSSTQPLIGEKLSIPDIIQNEIDLLDNREEKLGFKKIDKNKNRKTNNVPILYLSKAANGYLTQRNHLSPTILAIIKAIDMAESSINIMTPNFNIPEVIAALAKANGRGVEINLIMTKGENHERENMFFMGGDNEKGIKKLFKEVGKVESHDFTKLHVRWNTDNNKIVTAPYEKVMHTKLVCIDNMLTIAGSSVLDLLCAYHPRENDICIESKKVTSNYMKKIFLPIFEKGAEVFVDTQGKFTFTIPEVLEKLALTTDTFITLLEHKKPIQIPNEAMDKKQQLIGNILGNSELETSHTLYELKNKTAALLEKNSNEITAAEMEDLSSCYQQITQKISDANLETGGFIKNQGIFYQVKTFLSDVVRKFLNLKDNLDFAKKLTTHSLMNHLNEEILSTDSYLQNLPSARKSLINL